MATSLKVCEPFDTLAEAKAHAVKLTENHRDVELYLIISQGKIYVDDSSFIRNWEQLYILTKTERR